jgi:hypothetical protein
MKAKIFRNCNFYRDGCFNSFRCCPSLQMAAGPGNSVPDPPESFCPSSNDRRRFWLCAHTHSETSLFLLFYSALNKSFTFTSLLLKISIKYICGFVEGNDFVVNFNTCRPNCMVSKVYTNVQIYIHTITVYILYCSTEIDGDLWALCASHKINNM